MAVGARGEVKLHPAVAELRQQRVALHRLVSGLDLPDEEDQPVVRSQTSLRAKKAAEARWSKRDVWKDRRGSA